MEQKQKQPGTLALVLVLAAVLALGVLLAVLLHGRERTLADILPAAPDSELTFASLRTASEAEEIPLSQEQMQQLFAEMEQLHYKKSGMADGMGLEENYATLRYGVEGHLVELMFSRAQGGCILVNDVEQGGKAPLYRVAAGGDALEALLNGFRAAQ